MTKAEQSTPSSVWRARDDSGERGDTRRLAHVIAATAAAITPGQAVLLGFASDAGVLRNQGRPGAAQGPQAIRRMLAGLPAHTLATLHDAGDVCCQDGDLEGAQARFADRLAALLHANARPVALGGGHEIAWASFQGLRQSLDARGDTAPVLVLNLDAHFDLRTGRPASSGTPFDQIVEYCAKHSLPLQYACLGVSRLSNTAALFARAQEVGAFWVEDINMHAADLEERLVELDSLVAAAGHVYLTIDLDVLPAAVMPAVSAPAAYGVALEVIERITVHIARSGKLRIADLAECNPTFDIDNHGARVAARLAWRILEAWR